MHCPPAHLLTILSIATISLPPSFLPSSSLRSVPALFYTAEQLSEGERTSPSSVSLQSFPTTAFHLPRSGLSVSSGLDFVLSLPVAYDTLFQ